MALNETVTSVMAENPPLGTAAAASEGQVKFKEKLEEGFRNLTHDIVLWGNGSLEGVDLKTIPGFGPENCTGDQADCGQTRHTYFAIFMCSLIFSIFWITYITFLNSRVVGSIVTRLANSRIAKKITGDHGGHIEVTMMYVVVLYSAKKNIYVRVVIILYSAEGFSE